MPWKRVLANVLVAGTSVVVKAFQKAYLEAVQNAKRGGGQHAAQEAASKAMSKFNKRIPSSEARLILNLDKKTKLTRESIEESFLPLFEKNDVDNGGSFYLQSKFVRAKESLEMEIEEEEKANEKSSEDKSQSSAKNDKSKGPDDVEGLS